MNELLAEALKIRQSPSPKSFEWLADNLFKGEVSREWIRQRFVEREWPTKPTYTPPLPPANDRIDLDKRWYYLIVFLVKKLGLAGRVRYSSPYYSTKMYILSCMFDPELFWPTTRYYFNKFYVLGLPVSRTKRALIQSAKNTLYNHMVTTYGELKVKSMLKKEMEEDNYAL